MLACGQRVSGKALTKETTNTSSNSMRSLQSIPFPRRAAASFNQFLGISISGPTTGEFNFDNVRLTAVPEPSTYLAGLSALGILGWFGRKNRR